VSSHVADTPAAAHRHDAMPVENQRLGFWMFLGSECTFFASLIGSYLALHGRSLTGPGPRQLFEIPYTSVATFILLASSLTMGLGVAAMGRNNRRGMRAWLIVTAVLGLIFLGMQVNEFSTFWHAGLHLNTSLFSASFYTLTGFHGLHVTFGVAWIIALLIYSYRAKDLDSSQTVRFETAALYWHFVDVVWILIFSVVYLVGVLT
jgi:heme/copper-type cytochrome/quinol oxidase subunit 3